MKAAPNLFTKDVGSLLISQPLAVPADESYDSTFLNTPFDHQLFMVHWNSVLGKFVASRSIAYPDYQAFDDFYPNPVFGQTTFAPIDVSNY